MLPPDLQRLEHIRDYCDEIQKTIARYGKSFDIFDADADYQRSVSFCILQIGELPHKRKLHLPVRGIRTAEPAGSIQPDGMAFVRHSPDVHFGSLRDSI